MPDLELGHSVIPVEAKLRVKQPSTNNLCHLLPTYPKSPPDPLSNAHTHPR